MTHLQPIQVEAPPCGASIEHEDVQALIYGVWDANRKLDEILRYLYNSDNGEEEEIDPDA